MLKFSRMQNYFVQFTAVYWLKRSSYRCDRKQTHCFACVLASLLADAVFIPLRALLSCGLRFRVSLVAYPSDLVEHAAPNTV